MTKKLFTTTILIINLAISSLSGQSSEIRTLDAKKTKIQILIRAYQDTLADLDFMISELQSGSLVDYPELLHFKRPKTKNENILPKFSNNGDGNGVSQDNYLNSSEVKLINAASQRTSIKLVKKANNTLPRTYKPKVQPQIYKRRVGAICRDGTRSYATGRGACSHHGGVSHWLVE